MSARDPVLERLRALRPPDPEPAAAERAAVRILARLAVMEAGRELAAGSPRPAAEASRAALGRLASAAACLLALVLVPAAPPGGAPSDLARPPLLADVASVLLPAGTWPGGAAGPHRTGVHPEVADPELVAPDALAADGRDPWAGSVECALDGDAAARMRLLRGGTAARAALLRRARVGGIRGRTALTLLGQAGPLRSDAEAQAVAGLVPVLGLRRPALELLAGGPGVRGVDQLGTVLLALPGAEADAVRALGIVAGRGHRQAALRALLPGAAAGRRRAAARAFSIADAGTLAEVTASVPARLLDDPAVTAAVREGPVAMRAALLRRAAAGDAAARLVAARARLPGIVPLLATDAGGDDPVRARSAVAELAHHGGVDAWLAVGRALQGGAGSEAAELLRAAPAAARTALATRARASLRDAPAALVALAAAGEAGVAHLVLLAEETRLAPMAVTALATAASHRARDALAALAQRPDLAVDAIEALGRRLAAGDEAAGEALLHLARQRPDRAAFRALRGGGALGRALLRQAGREPALERRARATLGERSQDCTARRSTPALRATSDRPERARSI